MTHRLASFVQDMAALVEGNLSETALLQQGRNLLGDLVARDGWLGEEWTAADPDHYRQNLLFTDAQSRFSVVSFVWGPGQETPVHDHRTWGLIGILRGAEIVVPYTYSPEFGLQATSAPATLEAGCVDAVSPTVGDLHQVRNASATRPAVSIHVYGANIGQVTRAVYRPDGEVAPFVSGYSNRYVPNPWAPQGAA